MKLFIILVTAALISCKKQDPPNPGSGCSDCSACSETGTIRKGSALGLLCTDALFIVRNDNKIIQPVITHDLLNGFSEGDVIRFGHIQIFLGMRSCGKNIETAELICVGAARKN